MAQEYDIIMSIRKILNALAADIRKDKWDSGKVTLNIVLELCNGLEKKEFAKILKQRIITLQDTLSLRTKLISLDKIDTTLKFITAGKNATGEDLINAQFV